MSGRIPEGLLYIGWSQFEELTPHLLGDLPGLLQITREFSMIKPKQSGTDCSASTAWLTRQSLHSIMGRCHMTTFLSYNTTIDTIVWTKVLVYAVIIA